MKRSAWLSTAFVLIAIATTALAASAPVTFPGTIVEETIFTGPPSTYHRSFDTRTDGQGNRFVAYVTGDGYAAHVEVVKLDAMHRPVDTWIVAAPGAKPDACSIMYRDNRSARPGITKFDLEVFVSYHVPASGTIARTDGWGVAVLPGVFEPRPF